MIITAEGERSSSSEQSESSEAEVDLDWSVVLVNEMTRCNAEGAALGYFYPVEECAQACFNNECMFFLHDANDGECIAKYTESAECPEGLESSSYYHFYAIQWEGMDLESSESDSLNEVSSDSEFESSQVEVNITLIREGN
jgi:hypothetical protein